MNPSLYLLLPFDLSSKHPNIFQRSLVFLHVDFHSKTVELIQLESLSTSSTRCRHCNLKFFPDFLTRRKPLPAYQTSHPLSGPVLSTWCETLFSSSSSSPFHGPFFRYINARDKFGNDCAGGHGGDEFIVDINGIPVEMYIRAQSPCRQPNAGSGRRIQEVNTARRELPGEGAAFMVDFLCLTANNAFTS